MVIDEKATFAVYGYISTDCSPQSSKKVIAVCDICGKVRHLKKFHYRSLCRSCANSSARIGTTRSDETKKKISQAVSGEKNGMYGKTHSDSAKKSMSAARTGINNPNWRGGRTTVQHSIRTSSAMANWRTAVFQRDDYTCALCEQRGGRLEAHHIRPVRMNKNTLLIFDVANGITLCKDCHASIKYKELEYVEHFIKLIEDRYE